MTEPFPPGFFDRDDPRPDDVFYRPDRLVTHIDPGAIAAVGDLYAELGIDGDVLDLMSSWVSHFITPPRRLTVLGMNTTELVANAVAADRLVHDLNEDPLLPCADSSFDAVVCCVSVDYLTQPIAVFREVARVLRPAGLFVTTFSNRCFPTKAIQGWLRTNDQGHLDLVQRYFELAGGFEPAILERRTPISHRGDPLFTVWAQRSSNEQSGPGNLHPVA